MDRLLYRSVTLKEHMSSPIIFTTKRVLKIKLLIMTIDPKYKSILLEALEDLMYKLSLQLEGLKGGPLTNERKELTEKQAMIEELQHLISMTDV